MAIFKKSATRKVTATNESRDFGVSGAPINTQHPFYFGFLATAGALISLTLLRALASASQVFILIIISLFLALGMNPAVEALRKRGLSRSASVATLIVVFLIFLGAFIAVVVPPLFHQASSFADAAPQLINDLKNNSVIRDLNNQFGIIDNLNSKVKELISNGQFTASAFGGVIGVGRTVISGAFTGLTILILTLYFVTSLPQIIEKSYRLVPASRRERVSKISDAIIAQVGAFVGTQITVALLAGIFIWLMGLVVGVPFSAGLGMVVFICGLVPLIGHFLGMAIVTLVALTNSVTTAVIALVAYVLYVQVENYVITPRLMRRSLSIPGLVTILAALLGTSLLGLVGGLLAVPMAAAVLLILREVVYPNAEKR
ncbi:MAG: AI-2E family transporter [Candidatus Nanopelagicaceae bacterium]